MTIAHAAHAARADERVTAGDLLLRAAAREPAAREPAAREPAAWEPAAREPGSAAPAGPAAALAPVVGRSLASLTSLPSELRHAAAGDVAAAAAGLLDISLMEVLVTAWRAHHDLVAAARRTLAAPGSPELVRLVAHQVTVSRQPYVNVLLDGRRLTSVQLELSLTFDVTALTARVSAGRITALLAGNCDIRATLAVDGAQALDGGTRVHLPGAVSVRPPIQLLADADYASIEG